MNLSLIFELDYHSLSPQKRIPMFVKNTIIICLLRMFSWMHACLSHSAHLDAYLLMEYLTVSEGSI